MYILMKIFKQVIQIILEYTNFFVLTYFHLGFDGKSFQTHCSVSKLKLIFQEIKQFLLQSLIKTKYLYGSHF